jgi:hypothetical protein
MIIQVSTSCTTHNYFIAKENPMICSQSVYITLGSIAFIKYTKLYGYFIKMKEAVLSELSRCIPCAKEFEVPPHDGHLTV